MWVWFKRAVVTGGLLLWLAATAVIAQTISTNELALGKPAAKFDTFKQPTTLAELLALPPDQLENVDIALISLLCAEGLLGADNLNVQGCLETLDTWTRHIERETKRNFHRYIERPEDYGHSLAYYQMGMLGTVLAEDLRIQYNPELETKLLSDTNGTLSLDDFFRNSKDIFLHGLLTGQHFGTCASMPFLYASIGRRLGYPVTIAARKRHLYVRFDEGNGKHLNVESTENLGFSTPSDEEYRKGPYPMTDAEIQGMGWLRPLNNKEVLAICLFTRTACLRGNKRYDEEIKTLDEAGRYAPNTPLIKRVIQKGHMQANASRAAELWDDLENQHFPTGGPKAKYFRERKLAAQRFMNQSTNLAEIQKTVEQVKSELSDYRREISDDVSKMTEAFSPQNASSAALPVPETQIRRITIPSERVPAEYLGGVPPDLLARLQKLRGVDEMVEEMNAFYAEEMNLRSQKNRARMNDEALLPHGWQPQENFNFAQLGIRPENLPYAYRDMKVPPELQKRLMVMAAMKQITTVYSVTSEIQRYQGEQMIKTSAEYPILARRATLDKEPLMQPFLQIQIIPTQESPSANGILPLTGATQTQITPTSTGAGKP